MSNSLLAGAELHEDIKEVKSCLIIWKGAAEGAPCKNACPAGIDVPKYVRLVSEQRFEDALAVIREKVPFPGVLARVCHHPCESECRRSEVDNPIAIKALKRYVADRVRWTGHKGIVVDQPTGKRVAIVGSGPAGLTAAYYLRKCGGHSVTVFESSSNPGGMMRTGIPEYRLPRDILDAEINEIQDVGVEIKLNTKIEAIENLFDQGYNAVFLAMGVSRGVKMKIEGEDFPDVIDGLEFLADVNSGKKVNLGRRVIVIGGGNVAFDSARTAVRLGSKEVTIVYRRTGEEMPADPDEIEQAIQEGVQVRFLKAPQNICRANGKLRIRCTCMELGDRDAHGRKKPIPSKTGDMSDMDCDSVIIAIGQTPDIPNNFNLEVSKENTIRVNPDTLTTNREGVFSGGDAVSGAASVIEAIASGRKAAVSIDKFLGGNGLIDEDLASRSFPVSTTWEESILDIPRADIPLLGPAQRISSFKEVQLGLTAGAACTEAKRCLKCDRRVQMRVFPEQCRECHTCQLICSITYRGVFNPSMANIIIGKSKITYKDSCIGGCTLCRDYCPSGILERMS